MCFAGVALYLPSHGSWILGFSIWMFPKIGVPQNGWFIMVPNPIKMDDLGVPLFLETPILLLTTTQLILRSLCLKKGNTVAGMSLESAFWSCS